MYRGPVENRWDREFDERQRNKTPSEFGRLGFTLLAPEVGAYEWFLKGEALTGDDRHWFYFPTRRYCGQGCYIES
jgi:hypothetical protein